VSAPTDQAGEPVASGLVVVNKPGAMTSHDVVARVRRLAGTRKVGHAGTLDPMATGVLVLGIGRATRLLGYVMSGSKTYSATVRLGESRTTDDAEGEVTGGADPSGLAESAITAALGAFHGTIMQRPSAVSAIKVGGKRAYARVRAGEDVELAAREVTIEDLFLGTIERRDGFVDLDIQVTCGSGTYIRAIARDLGEALGVGGHLTALRRDAVGPFTIEGAATLAELTERFGVLPLADAARALFPSIDADPETAAAVRFGRRLDLRLAGVTALFDDGEFLALYEPATPELARPAAVFVG
jgi:tRNA pseudouridine55 synthase